MQVYYKYVYTHVYIHTYIHVYSLHLFILILTYIYHTIYDIQYFSESGKLVMKMFDHVQELADDPGCFVFILIDEVESIASARQASHTAQEPGDAVRVVNAVLTSLDSLKRRPNVLVLCTSNMLGSIDPAFCDRLDLQLYMGPPPESARFEILRSCVLELMDKRVIHDRLRTQFEGAVVVTQHSQSELNKLSNCRNESASRNPIGLLWRVAAVTEGMSGRLLRRLPLKAFSQCFVRGSICAVQLGVKYDPTTKEAAHTVHSVQTSTHSPAGTSTPRVTPESPPLSLTMFLLALEQVARDEKQIEGATPLDPSEDLQPKYFSQDPNQSLGGQYESTNSETEELSNDSHGNSEEVSSAGYAGGEGTKDDDEITVDGDDNEEAITPWNMIVN